MYVLELYEQVEHPDIYDVQVVHVFPLGFAAVATHVKQPVDEQVAQLDPH